MLCRTAENLRRVLLLILTASAYLMQGCATYPVSRVIDPHNAVPDNYQLLFFYTSEAGEVAAVADAVKEAAAGYGIPGVFVNRTNQIRAVIGGNNLTYLILNGRYPDAFIKDRISRTDSWSGEKYRRITYFYDQSAGIIIIFAHNNCIIAAFYDTSLKPYHTAEAVIDLLYTGGGSHPALSESTNMLISIKESAGDFLFLVPERFGNRQNIKEITFSLDRIINNLLEINAVFVFSSERDAVLFSPVFRIFFADLLRREGIGDFTLLAQRNSIRVEKNSLYIEKIELPGEKADIFIGKIFESTGILK